MSATTETNHLLPSTVRKHPIYWFEDGTLTLEVESQHFLVHRTLLSRHSRVLAKSDTDTRCISLPSNYKVEDLEALLQCLYHDKPLRNNSPFPYAASILRITSPFHLDFPYFHATAREIIEDMFSKTPAAFTHDYPVWDALNLAASFNLISVRKAIFYTLVTTTNFDVPDNNVGLGSLDPQKIATPSAETPTPVDGPVHAPDSLAISSTNSYHSDSLLSPEITETCRMLLSRIIEHFTPILFTPPATPHMECTDVFAETWGSLVILPAIKDNGVYKPLETLEILKEIDWAQHGLCASCVGEKRQEWTDEQSNFWNLMEGWLRTAESELKVQGSPFVQVQ